MPISNIKRNLSQQRAWSGHGASFDARGAVSASPPCGQSASKSATIHQMADARELVYVSKAKQPSYSQSVCDLCEKTVALALDVPLILLQAKTRQCRDVALARQIAMYLSHTMFSLPFSEIGIHFGRDRTTVSYACSLVEDHREKRSFELMICELEALLSAAVDAINCGKADCEKEVDQ